MHYSFGDNQAAINEVLDFIASGPLLQPVGPFSVPFPCRIVTTFEEAFAWADPEADGLAELDWTDVKEDEAAEVNRLLYSREDWLAFDAQMRDTTRDLQATIRRRLPPDCKGMIEGVYAAASHCIRSRAIQGTTNPFWESIFAAYQAGGMPCGWEGEHPDGKMVIFTPVR